MTGTAIVPEMGGLTFAPGVYTQAAALNIALANPIVTLDAGGDANAVFIFNAGTTLTTAANSQIVLLNGARADNVYWVLGTALTMGADSLLLGSVLTGTAITIGTNGKICGHALAQSAVTCETACTVDVSDTCWETSTGGGGGTGTGTDSGIALGNCEAYGVHAGTTATCAGAPSCDVTGSIGVSPGTSITGNFVATITSTAAVNTGCATDGLAAWTAGRAMTGTAIVPEMGGLTFAPGVYTHASAINIALANPIVTLDAGGNPNAVFIFNVGTTLTTCANSQIVLTNGAVSANVYWVLGTALTMGADSLLSGSVLAGTAITVGTNAKICGRAIAQSAITCETNGDLDLTC